MPRGPVTKFAEIIKFRARVGEIIPGKAPTTKEVLQFFAAGHELIIPLEGLIDLDAERSRLTKAIEAATKDRDSLAARLANPAFTERAKPEAVAKATEDHAARAAEVERLSAALARLG